MLDRFAIISSNRPSVPVSFSPQGLCPYGASHLPPWRCRDSFLPTSSAEMYGDRFAIISPYRPSVPVTFRASPYAASRATRRLCRGFFSPTSSPKRCGDRFALFMLGDTLDFAAISQARFYGSCAASPPAPLYESPQRPSASVGGSRPLAPWVTGLCKDWVLCGWLALSLFWDL